VWYEGQKSKVFDNTHVLETYFQDDVIVLRQACRMLRREFMQIGNIDVFWKQLQSLRHAISCCVNGF